MLWGLRPLEIVGMASASTGFSTIVARWRSAVLFQFRMERGRRQEFVSFLREARRLYKFFPERLFRLQLAGLRVSVFARMDDSGNVILTSGTQATGPSFALLRYHLDGSIDVVAYGGETAPGVTGSTFESYFEGVSVAANGLVSFETILTSGPSAIYQQSGAGAPVLLVMDGQTAPLSGGATFKLFTPEGTSTLASGATYFSATTPSGLPYFAAFLGAPSSIHPLMTTDDSLLPGSKVTLITRRPQAAGHFVGFGAQEAGGFLALFVTDLSSGTTQRVVTRGDAAPRTGGVISAIGRYSYMNTNGQMVFAATIAGGAVNQAIFLWSPSTGLAKVVAVGDVSPIPGATFSQLLTPSLSTSTISSAATLSPLNDSGQVVFTATYSEQSQAPACSFTKRMGRSRRFTQMATRSYRMTLSPIPHS